MSGIEFVTPVTSKASYSSGKVMLLLIVIAVLVGILLFFYWKGNEVRDRFDGYKNVDIAIHNTTPAQQFIDIPATNKSDKSRRVTINPYASETVQVPVGKLLKSFSHLPSGERVNDAFQVGEQELLSGNLQSGVASARNFVITQSGIYPERVLSRNVHLVNRSNYPIMFVEKVKDFASKRWSSDIIPPMSFIEKDFVAPNTLYDVVHPTKESSPLASTVTPLKTGMMAFTGNDILVSADKQLIQHSNNIA